MVSTVAGPFAVPGFVLTGFRAVLYYAQRHLGQDGGDLGGHVLADRMVSSLLSSLRASAGILTVLATISASSSSSWASRCEFPSSPGFLTRAREIDAGYPAGSGSTDQSSSGRQSSPARSTTKSTRPHSRQRINARPATRSGLSSCCRSSRSCERVSRRSSLLVV